MGPGFASLDPTELDDKDNGSPTKAIRSTVDLLLDRHTTVYKIDPVARLSSPPVRDELPLNAKKATVKLIVRDSSVRIGTAVIAGDQLEGLLPQAAGRRK